MDNMLCDNTRNMGSFTYNELKRFISDMDECFADNQRGPAIAITELYGECYYCRKIGNEGKR